MNSVTCQLWNGTFLGDLIQVSYLNLIGPWIRLGAKENWILVALLSNLRFVSLLTTFPCNKDVEKFSNNKASLDIYKNKSIFIPIDYQKHIFVIVAIIPGIRICLFWNKCICLNFSRVWLVLHIFVSKWKVCNNPLHLQDCQQVNLTWPTNNIFH